MEKNKNHKEEIGSWDMCDVRTLLILEENP